MLSVGFDCQDIESSLIVTKRYLPQLALCQISNKWNIIKYKSLVMVIIKLYYIREYYPFLTGTVWTLSLPRLFPNAPHPAGPPRLPDLPVCDNHPAELSHRHGHLQAQVHRAALQAVCIQGQLSHGYVPRGIKRCLCVLHLHNLTNQTDPLLSSPVLFQKIHIKHA